MSAATSTDAIQLTAFQERVLAVPQEFDLCLPGGRGGGKTRAIGFLILRHVTEHGAKARVLFVRRTHAALEDFAAVLREIFAAAYGATARYNAAAGTWTLPGGGFVELSQMAEDVHYQKFQGRNFSMIIADEATQHPTPRLLDLLRSNLRPPKGVPGRFILAANPDGPGHAWVARRHALKHEPWAVYEEEDTGAKFVTCPSTYLDNPFIDQDEYERQLAASCANDPELLKAWLSGDWSVARGAFFAQVLSEKRSAFGPWKPEDFWESTNGGKSDKRGFMERLRSNGRRDRWMTFLSYDHGSAAPAVCYLFARSPGAEACGKWFARDSLIALDEVAIADPSDLSQGLRYTVEKTAGEIAEMCQKWNVDADGCADDAIFNFAGHGEGSIADEFQRYRVRFEKAGKGDRLAGWSVMRQLLADAGEPDKPGLYISRACTYFWSTVPSLPRDPRRIEDVDSRAIDHAADAIRYGVGFDPNPVAYIAPLLY